jgi:hypothetical protein
MIKKKEPTQRLGSLRWVILVIYLGNHNPSKIWTGMLLIDIEGIFYMLGYLNSPDFHAVSGQPWTRREGGGGSSRAPSAQGTA